MEHTPIPWIIRRYTNYAGFSISSETEPLFGCIAERWEDLDDSKRSDIRYANADFIVQAVNSHDELLVAIQKLLTAIGHTPSETEDVQKYLNEGGEGYEAYSTGAEALTNATKEGM